MNAAAPNAGNAALTRYRAAWRWHFYAALVVLPFLLTLALSGLVMLYYSVVETPEGPRLQVSQGGQHLPPDRLLALAGQAAPAARASQYAPPADATATARFQLTRGDQLLVAELDPYSGEVLRLVDSGNTPYAWAHRIHGTLLLGDTGDIIVEIVAGLALLMVATGLYMWLLRRAPQDNGGRRSRWRRWHLWSGALASLALCFFIFSGLAWTSVWGGKLVQAWSTFPAERWGPVALAEDTHAAMNHGGAPQVPWGLEQTQLPASAHGHHALSLQAVIDRAEQLGFGPRYRINLPADAEGVFTLFATSMTGDITRFSDERTLHIDQYSGALLGEAGFADYSLAAKSMAIGVGLHQAGYGTWNAIANALACLVLIFLSVSGALLWWWRRPARSGLAAPPRSGLPAFAPLHRLLIVLGIAVPLLGLAMLTGLLLERASPRR